MPIALSNYEQRRRDRAFANEVRDISARRGMNPSQRRASLALAEARRAAPRAPGTVNRPVASDDIRLLQEAASLEDPTQIDTLLQGAGVLGDEPVLASGGGDLNLAALQRAQDAARQGTVLALRNRRRGLQTAGGLIDTGASSILERFAPFRAYQNRASGLRAAPSPSFRSTGEFGEASFADRDLNDYEEEF